MKRVVAAGVVLLGLSLSRPAGATWDEMSQEGARDIEASLRRGEGMAVRERFQRMVRREPKLNFYYAWASLLTRDDKDAEESFRVAESLDPNLKTRRAEVYVSVARFLDSESPKSFGSRGRVVFFVNEADKAGGTVPGDDGRWYVTRDRKLKTDRIAGHKAVTEATQLMKAGKWDKARDLLMEEARRGSEDPRVHQALAKALILSGNTRDASDHAYFAVKADPRLRAASLADFVEVSRILYADPETRKGRAKDILGMLKELDRSGVSFTPDDDRWIKEKLPEMQFAASLMEVTKRIAEEGSVDGAVRSLERDIALAKVRRTQADMRSFSTAFEAYAIDYGKYPASENLGKLEADLMPTFIKVLPRTDAWENPYRVEISSTRNDYRITSAGADGLFEMRPPLAASPTGVAIPKPKPGPGNGPGDDPGTDLVLENGVFVRWWNGSPTPVRSESLVPGTTTKK